MAEKRIIFLVIAVYRLRLLGFLGSVDFSGALRFYGGVDTAAPVAADACDWNDDVHVVNVRKTLCTEIIR